MPRLFGKTDAQKLHEKQQKLAQLKTDVAACDALLNSKKIKYNILSTTVSGDSDTLNKLKTQIAELENYFEKEKPYACITREEAKIAKLKDKLENSSQEEFTRLVIPPPAG